MKHDFAEGADGFAYCTRCGGDERSLPTECPGRPMTATEIDAVSDGRLNYRFGAWSHCEQASPALASTGFEKT